VAGLEAQQALAPGAVRLGGMLCRPPLARTCGWPLSA